jgi:hypothetical protein
MSLSLPEAPRLSEPRWSCRGNPPLGRGAAGKMDGELYAALAPILGAVKQEAPRSRSRASDRRISRSRVRHGHDLSGCKDAEGAMPNIAIRRAQRPRPERCFTPTCMAIASPPRSQVSNLENSSICAAKATDLFLLRLPMVNSTENIAARPEKSNCFSGPSQSS